MRSLLSLSILLAFSSCAGLMGGLRSDFDDKYGVDPEPTVGGRFASGGLLGDSEARNPASVGHQELNSQSLGRRGGEGSWLNAAGDERDRRLTSTRPMLDENGQAVPSYAANPSMAPAQQRQYKNGRRATKDDFVDDARNDGSLWTSDGQTNYYLTKNKVRGEGDLIGITSDEDLLKDIAAELKRTLSAEERDEELSLAQDSLRRKMLGMPEDPLQQYRSGGATDKVASGNAVADRAPAAARAPGGIPGGSGAPAIDVPDLTWADIDLRKNIDMKVGDPIMAEVIERFPNGNVKVRGVKKIRYRNQMRVVSMVGIARGADISDDDKLEAGKLYEYRLESLR